MLDYEKIRDFWDKRAKLDINNKSIISFQNVRISNKRYLVDKKALLSINLPQNAVALDLGCGIGKFSIVLSKICKKVIAVDFSGELLEKAVRAENIEYVCRNCLDYEYPFDFDLVVISGLLIYLNDDDVKRVVENIRLKENGRIFLRESVATERLEINKYSKRLWSNYCAIYRTPDEYKKLFSKFRLIEEKILYTHEFGNYTMAFIWRNN